VPFSNFTFPQGVRRLHLRPSSPFPCLSHTLLLNGENSLLLDRNAKMDGGKGSKSTSKRHQVTWVIECRLFRAAEIPTPSSILSASWSASLGWMREDKRRKFCMSMTINTVFEGDTIIGPIVMLMLSDGHTEEAEFFVWVRLIVDGKSRTSG